MSVIGLLVAAQDMEMDADGASWVRHDALMPTTKSFQETAVRQFQWRLCGCITEGADYGTITISLRQTKDQIPKSTELSILDDMLIH